eukprot:6150437-Pleurochrysis_carterae.AAC.1
MACCRSSARTCACVAAPFGRIGATCHRNSSAHPLHPSLRRHLQSCDLRCDGGAQRSPGGLQPARRGAASTPPPCNPPLRV